jgi:hypothetical protein
MLLQLAKAFALLGAGCDASREKKGANPDLASQVIAAIRLSVLIHERECRRGEQGGWLPLRQI